MIFSVQILRICLRMFFAIWNPIKNCKSLISEKRQTTNCQGMWLFFHCRSYFKFHKCNIYLKENVILNEDLNKWTCLPSIFGTVQYKFWVYQDMTVTRSIMMAISNYSLQMLLCISYRLNWNIFYDVGIEKNNIQLGTP